MAVKIFARYQALRLELLAESVVERWLSNRKVTTNEGLSCFAPLICKSRENSARVMFNYLKYLVRTAEANYLNNLFNEVKNEQLNINSFLDVGCYRGDNSLLLADACNAKTVYGMDFNKEAMLEASSKGIKVIYQDISEREWAVDKDSFDFVYSNQTIEHLYSVDNYILNIKRILKNKGYALISTENLSGWHNCLALLLGYQPFSTTNICTKKWSIGNPLSIIKDGHHDPLMVHRAVFTYYALEEFMKLYDFEIIKGITGGYYPLPNNIIGNFMAKVDRRHAVYIAVLVRNNK